MSDDSEIFRRDFLRGTGGAMGLAAGCLGGGGSGNVDQSTRSVGAANGRGGGTLNVANLYTPSRNAGAVIWRDEDTIYADGQDGPIAKGSDFSSVMQQTLDEGASRVIIQAGTYTIDTDIQVPSDTVIQGMGPKTRLVVNDGRGLWAKGSKGQTTSVTGDVEVGDDVVPVADTSLFEQGDYVLLNSDRTTDYRDQPIGEFQKIQSVDSANNRLVLEAGGIFEYYRTGDNPVVTRMNLVENVHIRDLEIVGSDRSRYRSGVVAEYANRVHVEDCKIHDLSHSAVLVYSSLNTTVARCELFDVGYPDAGIGYGVDVVNASRNITVKDNVLYDFKNHCTAVGGNSDGFPRLLLFDGNDYYGDDADVHNGDSVFFRDNRFTNCENGIITGAKETFVDGCTFQNIERDGIRHRGNPDKLDISNCTFRNIAGRGLDLYENPNRFDHVTVRNSVFRNIGSNVVRHRLGDGERMEHFEFGENVVDGCGTTPVLAETVGDGLIEVVSIHDNVVFDVGGAAFGTPGLPGTHLRITNNTIRNVENAYALVVRGRRATVSDNSFVRYSDRGVLVQCPTLLTGNHFVDGGYDALLVRDTSDVLAALNSFGDTAGTDIHGINLTDCKFMLNDVTSGIDVDTSANVVETNFSG